MSRDPYSPFSLRNPSDLLMVVLVIAMILLGLCVAFAT